jgi:hypothetical protein
LGEPIPTGTIRQDFDVGRGFEKGQPCEYRGEERPRVRPVVKDESVVGIYSGHVNLQPGGLFGMMEDALGFRLVPKKPSLERQFGQWPRDAAKLSRASDELAALRDATGKTTDSAQLSGLARTKILTGDPHKGRCP